MHVGLIGGIGPAGTITYYRLLTSLHARAGQSLSLTIAHADLPAMLARYEEGNAHEQAAVFGGYVEQLRLAGCEVVAIAGIAAHFCTAELEAVSTLPILSAITALEDYVSGAGLRSIGVLGTRPVMESRLYGISDVDVIIPPEADLAGIHSRYLDLSIAGTATTEQRQYLQEAGRRLCRDQGADAVLLAGTDLSLAFDEDDSDYLILDAAKIHAEAIARLSMTS